jgi:HD-GYP domain-containing protein (c-di-GMP phosphodiesterase class II)
MAQATANIVASAMHRVRLHEQAEQQMERLTTLRSIDLLILTSLDLDHVLDLLMEKITAVLHVDAADILLLDEHAGQLLLFASHGSQIASAQRESVEPSDDPFAWDVVASLQMQFVADLADCEARISESAWARFAPFTSYYAVPLTAKGALKGVLRIFHCARLDPSPDWIEFLQSLAGQAAIAVDNALLFQEQQFSNLRLTAAYEATIDGWSRALDQRDQETEGHSQRVTELTLRLAKRLGIQEDSLQHMRRGAQLHDIGKMGIPDQILLKAGPLTETEWATMRKHPGIARDLLSPIDFLQPALEIPFCHHEKWDGSGYPLGLKGEEIPLSARIFAVIDVWDALRSDRPYRRAWSKEQALAYIQRESGRHFDPRIVEAFIAFIECIDRGDR